MVIPRTHLEISIIMNMIKLKNPGETRGYQPGSVRV
jgi:hypothetical protein